MIRPAVLFPASVNQEQGDDGYRDQRSAPCIDHPVITVKKVHELADQIIAQNKGAVAEDVKAR